MARHKILVIDDHAEVRSLVAAVLDDREFDLSMAADGEAGIAKAFSEIPDLILLDLQMPRKDGVDTYNLLRSDGRTKSIPVIMMTGYDEKSGYLKKSLFAAGIREYIQKPIKPDFLKERVLQALRQREVSKPSNGETEVAVIKRGRIRIEHGKQRAWCRGKPLKLQPKLFELLYELARSGAALSSTELLRKVGFDSEDPKAVKAAINRLRSHIPAKDVIVTTTSGYQLVG